jgi:hypothetical protein
MKEPYEKGLASHSAPNPTRVAVTPRVWHGQGVHAGQPWSSEINSFRVPTLSDCGEGNTRRDVKGESWRDATESETLCMRGNSRRENREILLVSAAKVGMSTRGGTVTERHERYC